MSLHRYVVPPPLALAVEPAPPPKPHKHHSDAKDPKNDDKPNDKKEGDVPKGDAKAAETPQADKAEQPPSKPALLLQVPTPEDSPLTPASANSMIPEPPTPAPGAPAQDDPAPVPAPKRKATKQEDPKTPIPPDHRSPSKESKEDSEPDKEVKMEPLRLLGPAPHRPLRTRLQLNPSKPYPPLNTDPRGAYFKYARGVQAEWILIDVTKDGWLVDQWKEKPERDALARLRGEADKQRDREVTALERKKTAARKVPKTSEEILLQLWNDLAEAPAYELVADEFWARYDWSDPDAAIHLQDIKRPLTDDEKAKDNSKGKGDGEPKEIVGEDQEKVDDKAKEEDVPEPPVPWTCAGLEEVLATVGVQCAYKTDKPLSRHWAEPAGAYLVMAHGFFMLRVEGNLQWKTEEAANSFEILKTSHNDRVFGEMVKAQQMEDRKKREMAYRERKAAEKKKAEAEAARAKAEGRELPDKAKDKEGKDLKKDDSPASLAPGPDSPASNVAVKDGRPVKHEPHGEAKEVGAGAVEGKNGDVIVAVPVKGDKVDTDAKHEQEPEAVARKDKDGAEEKKDEKKDEKRDGKKDGEKKEADTKDLKDAKKPHNHHPAGPPKLNAADAKLLKEMIHGAGMPDSLAMEDIHLAFKAIEKAAEQSKADERNKAAGGPLIWTWQEPWEKWRWRNYEIGLQNVAPGGWEERDWTVFADGRGCEEYDVEESWAEADEQDVHDWSC